MFPTLDFSGVLDIITGICYLLIIIGVLEAFLWKLAFYIELAIGIIGTIVGTYIVYVITSALGLGFMWTVGAFFILLLISLIVAFLGAVLCLLEGFALTAIGLFFLTWVGGSTFSQSILTSVIVALILTGVAAFLGGYLDVLLLRAFRGSGRLFRRGSAQPRSIQPPEGVYRTPQPLRVPRPTAYAQPVTPPSEALCPICNLDFVHTGTSQALRCPTCNNTFHEGCLKAWVELNRTCPRCNQPLAC